MKLVFIFFVIMVVPYFVCGFFIPFRIQNAQMYPSFSLKPAHFMGSLNEKMCNKNPLRKIVVSKAITTALVENLSMELFEPSMVFQSLLCFDNNYFMVVYIVCYFGFVNYGVTNDNKKLGFMSDYTDTKRFVKNILFVLFFLFSKNVKLVY